MTEDDTFDKLRRLPAGEVFLLWRRDKSIPSFGKEAEDFFRSHGWEMMDCLVKSLGHPGINDV